MLKKSTLREIKTSIARYLAIFAIVALGVGFFAGLKDCKPSMVKMASDYLEEHNFYDYQIASSYGIDDESIEIAEGWEGVSGAEGSLQIDVMAKAGDGDSRALRAISLPENINTLSVVTGRLPENENECVIDDYSYSEDGYTNGDKIILTDENDKDKLKQFRSDEFTIVGTVTTPIFLDYQRGSTDIGNGSLDTFFYIQKEAFDEDYYSALYVTLEGDEEPFSEALDDKLESVSGSMDDLADRVNDARRETARKEAQEKLDKKKKDYEDKLADYEKEKADAEKKIRDARNQINSGEKTIAGTRKEIKAQIKDLKGKKKQVEKGISSAGAIAEGKASGEREKLKTAHEAGLISDEEYKAGMAAIDKQVASGTKKAVKKLKKQLKQINNGISKAEKGLKTLDSKEKDLNKNRKTLDREKRKADREFADAQKKLDEAKEKLDEAQEKIDDMETGNSYAFSRNDNAGYSSFDSNSSIVSNIARIFPVFFFLIAALVCMTTMTRMVEEQRTQIGVLKALGYSNSQIVAKYMFYSGSAAFLGACVGFFAGCKVFPTVIWNAYTMMYSFSPTVDYVIDPVLGIISLAAALVCSMGATWISIAQDFRVSPSELIRPKTPPAGKRILLERVTPLWKRISFLYKVSIRNIFRDKKRFLMMVIGVSGCTALLIAGLGIRTTIAKVADHQFEEISLYDFLVVFDKNMNAGRQEDFKEYIFDNAGISAENIKFIHQGEVTVMTANGNTDVTCTAAAPDDFGRFMDLHSGEEKITFPGEGEVVVVRKLGHDFGLKAGDKIKIRDGYREMEAVVSAVNDNYVYDSIYMSTETYEKGFGKKPGIKSAYVISGSGSEAKIREAATSAANYDHTAAVSVNIDVRENVSKMMKSLDAVVFAVILSAALLAFIVLYNLTNINITERIREIATIKVLGFNQLEVSQYVFRENLFLTAAAALVGIPAGKWLLGFVIDNIVVKMIYFEPRLSNMDIGAAVLLTFIFAGLVNIAMQRRLRNVSMTESLKSVE